MVPTTSRLGSLLVSRIWTMILMAMVSARLNDDQYPFDISPPTVPGPYLIPLFSVLQQARGRTRILVTHQCRLQCKPASRYHNLRSRPVDHLRNHCPCFPPNHISRLAVYILRLGCGLVTRLSEVFTTQALRVEASIIDITVWGKNQNLLVSSLLRSKKLF